MCQITWCRVGVEFTKYLQLAKPMPANAPIPAVYHSNAIQPILAPPPPALIITYRAMLTFKN